MRLSVTQLRVGILIGNLLLAAGVFGYAGYSYYGLTDRKDDYEPVDLNKLEKGLKGVAPRNVSSAVDMQASVIKLLPVKQVPEPIRGPDELGTGTEPATVSTAEGDYEPGFLEEEGYKYAGYFLRADPLENFVILSKETNPGGASPRISSSYAARRVTSTTRRVTTSSRRPTRAVPTPGNRLAFSVRRHQFTDPELELDFMIHSADENRFVYWIPGQPGTKYALVYEKPAGILREPDLGLRPPEEESAEGPEGAAEEPKPKSHFIVYTRDVSVERELEKEYRSVLEGEAPGRVLQARRGTDTSASSAAARPGPATSTSQAGVSPVGASRPGASSRGASTYRRVTPGARPEPRTTPTAEEAETLNKSLEKMTPEQRAEFQKALGGRR